MYHLLEKDRRNEIKLNRFIYIHNMFLVERDEKAVFPTIGGRIRLSYPVEKFSQR